jgi:hypothetical protein
MQAECSKQCNTYIYCVQQTYLYWRSQYKPARILYNYKLGLSSARLMLSLASKLGLKWASCYLKFVNPIYYVLGVASWVVRSCIPRISLLGSLCGTSPGWPGGRADAVYFKIKANSASSWVWAWAELGNMKARTQNTTLSTSTISQHWENARMFLEK